MDQPTFHPSSLSARYFPNIGSAGLYAPHALVVKLSPELPRPGEFDSEAGVKEFWRRQSPVIFHEYQHAVDHVGTVSGRALLDRLRDAYAALEAQSRGSVELMPKLVELHDAQRRFFRRGYFTVSDHKAAVGSPRSWRLRPTIGASFDLSGRLDEQDPILFVTFEDSATGRRVARQPLAAAALFEVRAVHVEIEHELLLATADRAGTARSLAELDRYYGQFVYHPGLTMYSAPVHMVSNRSGAADVATAYRLTASLAGIALNVTRDLPLNLSLPKEWPQASSSRGEALIHRRDPGMLFACLVDAAPTFAGDPQGWVQDTVEAAGFPSVDEIYAAAGRFLAFPSAGAGTSWFDRIYWRACEQGAVNFARLWPKLGLLDPPTMAAVGTPAGPIALPHTMVGNLPFEPAVDSFTLPQDLPLLLAGEVELAERTADFLSACR